MINFDPQATPKFYELLRYAENQEHPEHIWEKEFKELEREHRVAWLRLEQEIEKNFIAMDALGLINNCDCEREELEEHARKALRKMGEVGK